MRMRSINRNIVIGAIVVVVIIILGIAVYNSSADLSQVAQNGDTVYVNYTGTLENGTKFDSSYDRGQPLSFVLGQGAVIKGWDNGILGMRVGEKKHLVIPADQGYGTQSITDAQGNVIIPRNSTLIFDVELVKIDKNPANAQ